MLKKLIIPAVILSAAVVMVGCSKVRKTDSTDTGCAASECHQLTSLKEVYPSNDARHVVHVQKKGFDCTVCHNDYNNVSLHKNGTTDSSSNNRLIVYFDKTINPSGSFDIATRTCNNMSCHGSIAWDADASAGCTVICHLPGNTYTSDNPVAPDPLQSGSHNTHLSGSGNLTCGECHENYTNSNTHNNGTLNTSATAPGMVTFDQSHDSLAGGTYNPGTGTCTDTYCHGGFTGGGSTGSGTSETVTWGSIGSVTCGSCHPAGASSPTSVKHTPHLAKYTDQCGYCHQGYTKTTAPAGHLNFRKDVNFGYPHPSNTSGSPTYISSSKTCENVYCHGNFPLVTYNGTSINPGNGFNPTWQSSSAAPCGACHGSLSNNYSSGTHGKHTSTSAGYFNDATKIESCDACHNYGTDTDTGFTASSTQGSYQTVNHVNFSIDSNGVNADVNFKTTGSDLASTTGDIVAASTSWNSADQTCSNSWCHGNFSGSMTGNNTTPDWLDSTTAVCGDCHTATTGTSGAHATHTSAPYSYACGKCHGSFTGHVNGNIAGTDVNVSFDSTNPNGSYSAASKTCTNLYCHGNSTGGNDWGTFYGSASANNNNPIWTVAAGGGPGSVACGDCHDATAATLTTGRHIKHVNNSGTNYNYPCRRCHADTFSGDTTTFTSGHADGNLVVNPDGNNPSGIYAAGTRQCSGFYCHGNFTGGNTGNVADWDGGTGGTCGNCHDLAPANTAYGSHDKHTNTSGTGGYNYDCSLCHSGIASGQEGASPTLVSVSNHANFTRNIVFSGIADQGPGTVADYSTATNLCSNTYCHGDFRATDNTPWLEGNTANTPNWTSGAGGAACGTCHGTTSGNNAGKGIPGTNTAWHGTREAHVKHAGDANNTVDGYGYPCGFCHNGVYDANLSIGDGYGSSGSGYESGTKSPDPSQHADGVRTPLSFYTAFTNTVNFNDTSGLQEVTCNSLYCHSDGWSTERTQIDTTSDSTHTDAGITWNETTTCTSCHRSGSTSTNYAPDHPGYTGNGRHYGKSSHRSNCYNCHYSVVTTSTNTVIDYAGNRHVNKWHNIDLRNSGSYSGTSSRTCNPSCHGSETWRNSTDYLIRNYVFE